MIDKKITIYCENNDAKIEHHLGTKLKTVLNKLNLDTKFPIIGALVNNKVKDLDFSLVKPKKVQFIDYLHTEGYRMYCHSLQFLLYVAVREAFPQVKLSIMHEISNGYYCELLGLGRDITVSDIEKIKYEMHKWINKDVQFIMKEILSADAVNELIEQGLEEKACLFEQQGNIFSHLYYLENYCNYFYGPHVPSTSYLKIFNLVSYSDGMLLQAPSNTDFKTFNNFKEQEKLLDVFKEYKSWVDLLNLPNLHNFNELVDNNNAGFAIKIAEALQEKKVAEIANIITTHTRDIKIVFIAGPSASGKTTFSKRLSVQLAVNGISPHVISLDDYFVNREDTPLDENGNYNFESLHAININLFNKHLTKLLNGETIELPRFDFQFGKQVKSGKTMQLDTGHILIIEGIHGINPELTPNIKQENCFKIFISALTQISLDDHNYIASSDNRLIRRMVRDSKYRGYSAEETIKRWQSVRQGEELNIIPYQENADIMFNSALIYELLVLKKYAEPLLKAVAESCSEYCQANRLLTFFSYLRHIDDKEIPPTSLLREFLGGSSFNY